MERSDYFTKGIERMFRGTPYQPLYQPYYPRNALNRILERFNGVLEEIERREIKKQNIRAKN